MNIYSVYVLPHLPPPSLYTQSCELLLVWLFNLWNNVLLISLKDFFSSFGHLGDASSLNSASVPRQQHSSLLTFALTTSIVIFNYFTLFYQSTLSSFSSLTSTWSHSSAGRLSSFVGFELIKLSFFFFYVQKTYFMNRFIFL